MSETQHTPQPWERKDRYPFDGYKREVFGGGKHIASVHTAFGVWEANEANANLIAAAPDLLDVLERINAGEPVCSHASHWRGLVDDWDVHTDLCQAIRAAIAKAKGEANAS